eukprot:jgi/Mesen1/5048/ME000252S04164
MMTRLPSRQLRCSQQQFRAP